MVLNKTNNTPDKATYLDINIEIINGKFVTKIYDKRRDFNFKIISLPHISGNVPVTPTYGVFISQVHRFFTANNSIEGFYAEVKALTSKLVKQGFTRNKMKYFLVKYVHNRFLDITFNTGLNLIIVDVFKLLLYSLIFSYTNHILIVCKVSAPVCRGPPWRTGFRWSSRRSKIFLVCLDRFYGFVVG